MCSDIYCIRFKTIKGANISIDLDENCPVGILIIHFYIKINNIREIMRVFNFKTSFVNNSTVLRINDNTPIKKIFNNNLNPCVLVDDNDNLIGG